MILPKVHPCSRFLDSPIDFNRAQRTLPYHYSRLAIKQQSVLNVISIVTAMTEWVPTSLPKSGSSRCTVLMVASGDLHSWFYKEANPQSLKLRFFLDSIRMASSTPEIPCILPRLPKELTNAISQYLHGSDLKALRETCSAMAQAVPLHFDRVFISANSLNI